jgi:hypothetical protein
MTKTVPRANSPRLDATVNDRKDRDDKMGREDRDDREDREERLTPVIRVEYRKAFPPIATRGESIKAITANLNAIL